MVPCWCDIMKWQLLVAIILRNDDDANGNAELFGLIA